MRLHPFQAWRPAPEFAGELPSVPYDVVDRAEAAALAVGRPHSFLRITRAEIELPGLADPYAPEVYTRARANYDAWRREGVLLRDTAPGFYLYRLRRGRHSQSGIVACCHVDDYRADVIKKHERTRREKEADRTRHIDLVNAQTGPVLLTYRDHPEIDRLVAQAEAAVPLYDFQALDGVEHAVWTIPAVAELQRCFQDIPVAYIADGHHRAASSVSVAECRRAAGAADTAECNWFMTMLFPAGQMNILPYNRLVGDLNGLPPAQLLQAARRVFDVSDKAVPPPSEPGVICMYLDRRWYNLRRRNLDRSDPVAALDVSALQSELLAPVLGIDDPRTNPRIDFIGGSRGTEELERRVSQSGAGVAFAMHPVTVEQLMAIADRGLSMPPKSTWFDPKPCSGLLVHDLGDR